METKMTCPNCKQPLDPGAEYCGNCGQKIITNPQPAITPIPQVAQPQPATQSTLISQPTVAPTPQPVPNPVVPAYAVDAKPKSGETKSIISLILGILGIPASFIPIAGLVLGVTGLILGTTSRVKYKHTLNLLAIIFSIIAIVASLGMWVWAIDRDQKAKQFTSDTSINASNLVTVSTPCYSVKLDKGLKNYKPSGCNIDAGSINQQYAVVALTNNTVTLANLMDYGQKALDQGAATTGGTTSEAHLGKFAGAPAYIVKISSPTARAYFAYVLHATTNGENTFIVGKAVPNTDTVANFGLLESTWVWK